MVIQFGVTINLVLATAHRLLFAVDQQAEPLLVRLDPERRAKMLMALVGVVLVGLGLVALAWLGGRRMRRITRKPLPPTQHAQDSWYRKPLVPQEPQTPSAQDLE